MRTTDSVGSRQPSLFRSSFLEGALSALAVSALMVAARFLFAYPTWFDLSENWITRLIPANVFAFFLDRLLYSAKPLLFAGVLVGQVLLGGLGGLVFQRLRRSSTQPGPTTTDGAIFGVVVWAIQVLAILPLIGQGIFGRGYSGSAVLLNLYLLLTSLGYAEILALLGTAPHAPVVRSRRQFLGGLAAGASSLAVLAIADRLWVSPSTALPDAENFSLGPTLTSVPVAVPTDPGWDIPGLSPEITPIGKFYQVTKNLFADPDLAATDWSLTINGRVRSPVHLSFAELTRLPAVEFYQTLECISNPVGGDLMSTAWWRGVPVKDLLAMAGANPQASKVVFRAADGYADSIPLAHALLPSTTLVYEMDGQPLPKAHGFPVRLITPGVYGLKNVKWLTGIEVIDGDFEGYWQQRGWSDTAIVQTTSRVDVPVASATVAAGRIVIAGIAFAGNREIKGVQVSLDAGGTWEDATLKPALGPLTWRFWRYEASLKSGSHSVAVRAIDGEGQVQWPLPQDTVPDGATGYDVEVFTAR